MNNTTRIIRAAVSVFAEKGFNASTISDLAKKAGVGEATIYNHFQNKADILLTLPVPYIKDFMDSCDMQLKGIKHPEEKMRKFIWQSLRWAQEHRDHIKVLLTDILPEPQLYTSKAFKAIQKGPQMITRFLDQGKREGYFKEDTDQRMFIVFFFGTLAYHLLAWVMFGRTADLLDDFDDIAGALTAAIKDQNDIPPLDLHDIKDKKERILLAGEMLFSEEMSGQTTISKIAKTAGVADGTIYDYFQNKEALLFQIFNKRMKDFLETYQDTIAPDTPESRLKLSVYHFLSWVQNHRAWAKVFIRDIVTNPGFYISEEHGFKQKHDEKLLEILAEGKKRGIFRKHIKAEVFLALFFGPIYFICLPWAMRNQGHSLTAEADQSFALLLRAIKKEG